MAKLDIIIAPDPRLKLKCAPVARVDAAVRKLMDDMLETMYAAPGVGLAAPQVGVTKRVIVVDAAAKGEPPEHYADVVRPRAVRVRYLDHENEIRELEADGLLATCIQHEMDHLDGILFVDHITALKRNIILRKLLKAKTS